MRPRGGQNLSFTYTLELLGLGDLEILHGLDGGCRRHCEIFCAKSAGGCTGLLMTVGHLSDEGIRSIWIRLPRQEKLSHRDLTLSSIDFLGGRRGEIPNRGARRRDRKRGAPTGQRGTDVAVRLEKRHNRLCAQPIGFGPDARVAKELRRTHVLHPVRTIAVAIDKVIRRHVSSNPEALNPVGG